MGLQRYPTALRADFRQKKIAWAVADHFDSGGAAPMPWPWVLCTHCMDMQSGNILNWPLGQDWERNAPVLAAMRDTWHGWLFHTRTNNPKHTKWTEWEVGYEEWLQNGREQLPDAPSDLELWAKEQGYLD